MREMTARRHVAVGLLLQGLGVGGLALLVFWQSRREDALGAVTKYTVRLAWHDALHQWRLGGLVAACVLVYLAGAVVLARPFINSRVELLVAVPFAALIGLLVLGLFVFIIAAAVGLIWVTEGDPDAVEWAAERAHHATSRVRRTIRAATRFILRRSR